MTATIRRNLSRPRTHHVNRERSQNRRATGVSIECDSWQQRNGVGRRQFSYTSAPHGRACVRNGREFRHRSAAKNRRHRHMERKAKMDTLWDICESEPHIPTSSLLVKAETAPKLFGFISKGKTTLCSVREKETTPRHRSLIIDKPELGIKLGSDRFHLKNTYTLAVYGEMCLARFSYNTGEWRVVPLGHFMDYPTNLQDNVDWAPMSIGRLKHVAHLPEDPNVEDIKGAFVERYLFRHSVPEYLGGGGQ